MTVARVLIVNADDVGQSLSINRGTARAIDEGIVTSVSLMVSHDAAEDAVAMLRARQHVSIGLHFDIAEWEFSDGEWRALYQRADETDEHAVARELDAQLTRFHVLVGRPPTHIDSHQHVHRREPVKSVVGAAGEALGVPVRELGDVRYDGSFYGQHGSGQPFAEGITVDRLREIVSSLADGVTELGCHPGEGSADSESMYVAERSQEMRALCDPAVRDAIVEHGVVLRSFATYRDH